MSTRRSFLTTLGKAIGAGGVMLPWTGNAALALPRDLGPAAQLPVTQTAPTFSPEALRLRELRETMFRSNGGRDTRTWNACVAEYRPLIANIADRPNPTWQDVVELAEELWRVLPKEEINDPNRCYHTGALSTEPRDWQAGAYHCRHELVTLVEVILTLGGGERRDTRAGFFPEGVRPVESGSRA